MLHWFRERNNLGILLRYGWIFLFIVVLLVLFLLNVSIPGRGVEGCLDGCAKANEQESGVLRIVSLNMLHGFPRFERLNTRLDVLLKQVQQLDADIILLQEVPWNRQMQSVAGYLSERLGMNYLYYRANGNRQAISFEEGEAILSRYPLKSPLFIELNPQAGFFEHRVVLQADVETPRGDIRLFVTHLTNGKPEINRQQVDSLLEHVQASGDMLKIIAGDFNAGQDSSQIALLSRLWVDVFREANPDEAGFTCCIDDLNNDPSEPLERRIDYIFMVAGENTPVNLIDARLAFDKPEPVEGGWQWVSDHVGMVVTFEYKDE